MGGIDPSEDNMSKKDLALQQALDQITSSFGKESIMWLGSSVPLHHLPVVSTGSFALDLALGTGGLPKVSALFLCSKKFMDLEILQFSQYFHFQNVNCLLLVILKMGLCTVCCFAFQCCFRALSLISTMCSLSFIYFYLRATRGLPGR